MPESAKKKDEFQEAFDVAASRKETDEQEKESRNTAEDKEQHAKESEPEKQAKEDSEDLQTMLQREQQRLKSLEGRFRKEKAAWEDEKRELLAKLEQASQAVQTSQPAGDTAQNLNIDPATAQSLQSMIQREIRAMLQPLVSTYERDRRLQAITAAHPDVKEVVNDEQLPQWIEEQPDYIAATMREVLKKGAPEQVIDLITRFKQARSRHTAPRREPAMSEEQSLRAQQAAAVRSRSAGPPPSKPNPDDYMAAWKEAISR